MVAKNGKAAKLLPQCLNLAVNSKLYIHPSKIIIMKGGTIYLNFNGNAEEVFNYNKAVIGGEYT
jgi:hypothetical protein